MGLRKRLVSAAADIGDGEIESKRVLKWIVNDQLLESLLRVCLSFVNEMDSVSSLNGNSVSEGAVLTQRLVHTALVIQKQTTIVH